MYFLGAEVTIQFFVTTIFFWGLFGTVVNWLFGPTKRDIAASAIGGFKRAVILAAIVMAVSSVINWFKPQQQEGTFTAAVKTVEVVQQPLQFDVDFVQEKSLPSEVITTVQTNAGSLGFSNYGASLVQAVFARELSGSRVQSFPIWHKEYFTEKNQYPFMVALEKNTPFVYELIDHTSSDEQETLVYKAYSDQGTITKTFEIDKREMCIDCTLTMEPKKSMKPRLMWISPILKDLGEYDTTTAFAYTAAGKYVSTSADKVVSSQGYIAPTLFGSADKYFVSAMIKDHDTFVHRAYNQTVNDHIVSYLEAEEITEPTTWKLTFYIGPKELKSLKSTDTRLEAVLDYGMFSFISKPMMTLLNYADYYTHNYGYAILLVTLLLKLLLLPFTFRGDKKMREFQESQRKLEYIEKKYKDNPEMLQKAKQEHVMNSGMGMLGGCLTNFVQMPFFLGLQGALRNSVELYGQPFLWIKDLSMPDQYYIIPLLLFLSFLITFYINGASTKGTRKVLWPVTVGLVMAGIGTIMSSGLSLFLLSNNLLQIVQIRIQKAFKL